MSKLDGLTVNFTFSPEARSEIERVRAILRAASPRDAMILSVGWGIFKPHQGGRWEAPALGFYDETDDPVILGGVCRLRDEHGLAGHVADAEVLRDRRARLDVVAAQQ